MNTPVSFETAKLAKEKGFNINSFYFYAKPRSKVFGVDEHGRTYPIVNKPKTLFIVGNAVALNIKNIYLAPSQSLLQKWLREKHDYHINTYRLNNKWCADVYRISEQRYITRNAFDNIVFDTYEKALEVGLLEALKLIK